MVTLKVDKRRYSMDGNPTVEQWEKLMHWDFESPVHWPHIIEAITDLPYYVINEMTPDQQQLAVTMIGFALTQRKPVALPDFEAVTFGTFVDLEYCLTVGTQKTLKQMLELLGTPHENAQEALWVVENWIKWRNNIYKQYSALFGLNDRFYDEEETQKKMTPQKVASDWYRIIVDLANDDLLKIEDITNKKVKEVFNFMAVRKEKQMAELRQLKEQKRQYDIQKRSR